MTALRPEPTDLLRVLALVSVPLATWWGGAVGFALFMLVLGGVMLPRALGARPWLDVTYCGWLIFGGWAAQLDWYMTIDWLDLVVHGVVTGLVATMAHLTLVRVGALPARLPRLGTVCVVASFGMLLAVVWEFGEWFGHAVIDDRIQVGYEDTLSDLAAGMVGAFASAWLVGPRGRRGWDR